MTARRLWMMPALAACTALPLALSQPGPATAAPGDTSTLTVATMWEVQPLSLKPRRSRFFNESEILDTLVKLDHDMALQPGLALAWERDTPTTWRFTLREGVTFHDGTPLTAEAVIGSLNRVMEELPYAAGLLDIKDMRAEGPRELVIETNQPFAALPNQLTDAFTGIHAASSFDDAGAFIRPVGTGPFRFVEYRKQDRTILERFPDYWGKAPTLERVVYRFIPDHAARTLSLEAGQVDLALNILPSDARRLADSDAVTVHRAPIAGLYYMVLNTAADSPLHDPRLREAVAQLIDRDALVEHALDGVGLPARQFFSPALDMVAGPVPTHDTNIEAARALLAEAGYIFEDGAWRRDGEVLSLDLISYSSRTEMPLITEAVAGLLGQAGVTATPRLYTWPGMLDRARSGDYDAYVVFWTPEMTGHPDQHLSAQFHSARNALHNGYTSGELDALLERARGLDAGPKRDEAYRAVLEILHRDVPIVPLVHKVGVAASHDGLKGFRLHPSGFFHDFKSVSKVD